MKFTWSQGLTQCQAFEHQLMSNHGCHHLRYTRHSWIKTSHAQAPTSYIKWMFRTCGTDTNIHTSHMQLCYTNDIFLKALGMCLSFLVAHTHASIFVLYFSLQKRVMYVCIYTHTYIYIVYIYVYVYVCIYIHTYIHTYICTYIHTHAHDTCTHMHTYSEINALACAYTSTRTKHTYAQAYRHTQTTHAHWYSHVYSRTHMHTHTARVHTCGRIMICTFTYTLSDCLNHTKQASTHTHIHTYTHAHTYTHTHLYTHMHLYLFCIFLFRSVSCMYVYTYM
jgi:hypothetical protein